MTAGIGSGVNNLRAIPGLFLLNMFWWLLLSVGAGMVGMISDGAMLNSAILSYYLLAG